MNIPIYIMIALVVVLCAVLAFLFVRKCRHSKRETLYIGLGVPKEAPISVLDARLKVDSLKSVPLLWVDGWFQGSIIDMEFNNGVPDFPLGFSGVWAALTEKQVYELDVLFPEEMVETAVRNIKEGFVDRHGNRTTYSHLKAAIFPEGIVRFYLMSSGKTQCLDYSFQGTPTSKYDGEFLHRISNNPWELTIEKYHNIYYEGGGIGPSAEYVNNVALPNRIWEKYYKRYDYKINFVFENPDSRLDFWATRFSNAEHFGCQNGVNECVVIENPAILCSMYLWWKDRSYLYISNLYFNENEMLSTFEKAFDLHSGQHGELCVVVGKDNKKMELSLNIGEEKYPLKEVEFDVTRGSELVCKNYKKYRRNCFKGL